MLLSFLLVQKGTSPPFIGSCFRKMSMLVIVQRCAPYDHITFSPTTKRKKERQLFRATFVRCRRALPTCDPACRNRRPAHARVN